jgi:hypothetical protein
VPNKSNTKWRDVTHYNNKLTVNSTLIVILPSIANEIRFFKPQHVGNFPHCWPVPMLLHHITILFVCLMFYVLLFCNTILYHYYSNHYHYLIHVITILVILIRVIDILFVCFIFYVLLYCNTIV